MTGNARRIMAPIFESLTRRAMTTKKKKRTTRVKKIAPIAETTFCQKVSPLSLADLDRGCIAIAILLPVFQLPRVHYLIPLGKEKKPAEFVTGYGGSGLFDHLPYNLRVGNRWLSDICLV